MCSEGDSEGDLGGTSTTPFVGGKFWALGSLVGDDDGVVGSPISSSSEAFWSGSPDRSGPSSSRRADKRIEKRRLQREAARILVDSSLEVCVPSPSRRSLVDLRIPVLPPSTFLLESFDAKEWIRVQRIKNKQRYNKGMVVRSSRFGSWDAKDHRDLRRSPAVSARSGRDGSHSKKN
jgi:hypothetical protein